MRGADGVRPGSAGRVRGLGHRIGVIWRLEADQMLRPASIAWGCALAALPTALLAMVRLLVPPAVETPGLIDAWLYLLIPILLVPLALILTATSAIHTEIENRSWIYLALRPGARPAALGGKYLFAVTWALGIAVAATLLAALLLWGIVPPVTVVRTIGIALLAAFAYGALYLLIGVAFLRIGMVVAIAYSLAVEVILGNVPAILNRVTISHHLRSLFLRTLPEDQWAALSDVDFEVLLEGYILGAGSIPFHLTVLVGIVAALLLGAGALLRAREIAVGEAE